MKCNHMFAKEYQATLIHKVENPFSFLGSSDVRLSIDQENNGYARTCDLCGFTEFTTNTKTLIIPDFE